MISRWENGDVKIPVSAFRCPPPGFRSQALEEVEREEPYGGSIVASGARWPVAIGVPPKEGCGGVVYSSYVFYVYFFQRM